MEEQLEIVETEQKQEPEQKPKRQRKSRSYYLILIKDDGEMVFSAISYPSVAKAIASVTGEGKVMVLCKVGQFDIRQKLVKEVKRG